MTKTELIEKLSNTENISALAAEIADAADDAAVLEILKKHNVELSAEDVRSLSGEEEELSEDSLNDVTGGCKCKGPLKRFIVNVVGWLYEKATGNKFTCLECND